MLSVTEYQVDSSELVVIYQYDFMSKISKLVTDTQQQPTGNRYDKISVNFRLLLTAVFEAFLVILDISRI